MGSAKPQERSLGSGISLPQWMKGKIDRFDFEQGAFSPPSQDDSFFYIRYPREPKSTVAPEGFKNITQVINENTTATTSSQVISAQATTQEVVNKNREIDFSKHPLPCQPYVPTTGNKGNEFYQPKIVTAGKRQRSQGTDDGFHSEPALCGKSIVHVANQMMSGKFNKSALSGITQQHQQEPQQQPQQQQQSDQKGDNEVLTKGSRSLPATPLASPMTSPNSSPKTRRRVHVNRYFTGPFIPDREKYQNGWILSSILGQSREMVVPKIEEEDESGSEVSPPLKPLSRKKSISSQNLTYIGKEEKIEKEKSSMVFSNVFQAKPSELREMNFWSPTSM